jgi:hypothetical protein
LTTQAEINTLGTVVAIVAPNLQHWLFIPAAHELWPQAKIYVTPAACNEDLADKMPDLNVTLLQDGHQIHADIDQQLLAGGPLYMNEYLFFHSPSRTLVTSDGYYGGYTPLAQPGWFGRLWFKCTKGTFKNAKLPIYRTARILTHGNIDELIACAKKLIEKWDFGRIVMAHGTNFWPADPAVSFLAGWEEVLDMRERQEASANAASSRKTKRVDPAGSAETCITRKLISSPGSIPPVDAEHTRLNALKMLVHMRGME